MTIAAVSVVMMSAQTTDRSTHAPTFDVMGSLFPAWLACLAAAILFTALSRNLEEAAFYAAFPIF